MYKLTIECNSLSELGDVFAKLNGNTTEASDTPQPPKAETPKAPRKKPEAKAEAKEPAPKAEEKSPEPAAEESLTGEPAEFKIEYKHVKDATVLLQKVSRETAVNLLAKFGVKIAPDLKEKDFDAYVNSATTILGENNISVAGTSLETL